MRLHILFIALIAISGAMASTYTYRDGDWRINYDESDGEIYFENGWFAFNDMVEIDTNRDGPITNGTEDCLPRVKKGGTWYEFGDAEHVSTDATEANGYFEILQQYYNANVGNFTRRFVTTFDTDMYILVQEEFRPITGVYNLDEFRGTCFDFQNWEPTQVYAGQGLIGGEWTGGWTASGSIEPQDFTTWNHELPFQVYAKILNNATIYYREADDFPTTFTHYSRNPDAHFEFEDNLFGLTFDYFQSVMDLGTTSLDADDHFVQSLFLSLNSHDPRLSPYYVDKQQSRSPQELYMFGGGKIGGYDAISGYSYNLHSLASYGAKFASMYWNRPTQDEEYGYLIDRDLYRQSFSHLAKLEADGEDFTTKYHYNPDEQPYPNNIAYPEEHFEMYDIAQLGLYSVIAQMALQKSTGDYGLNADPDTESLLDDVVEYALGIVQDGDEPVIQDWLGYYWLAHDWQKAEYAQMLYDAETAPTTTSGNVLNTTAVGALTEGLAARRVWFDAEHATTWGYIQHTISPAANLSRYRTISIDMYTPDPGKIDNEPDDIRMRLYDTGGDYAEWLVRNQLLSTTQYNINVDLYHPNTTSGVLNLEAIDRARVTFYDNNSGDYYVVIDNYRAWPIWFQRSYVLNTHLEALLMMWKMKQYGYAVDETLMYNLTDSLVHYLPAFERDIANTSGDAMFLDYRIWFNETPFNGSAGNDYTESWGIRYHWFSTGILLQLIDAIRMVDPDYDISQLQETARKACRYTIDHDTTDMSTKPSNSNTRLWCAFNGGYDLLKIAQSYAETVNVPGPVYAEDVALARTNMEFDRAFTSWLYKVPGANAIITEVYGKPDTPNYLCPDGSTATFCTGELANYWATNIETYGLGKYLDDPTSKVNVLFGYPFFNLENHMGNDGTEISFQARNYNKGTDQQFWVFSPVEIYIHIKSSEVPIENMTCVGGWCTISLPNGTNSTEDCVNKRLILNADCKNTKLFDITPECPDDMETFTIDEPGYTKVVVHVIGIDADGKCGYEKFKVKFDEGGSNSCLQIEKDPINAVDPNGDSNLCEDGKGGGGNEFQSLDDILGAFGLQSVATKGLFALIITGLLLVVGGRFGGVYGAVGMGALSMLFFAWVGYFPIWLIILVIILCALGIGMFASRIVSE